MTIFWLIILLVLVVIILLGAWRFFALRGHGTPVRIRELPAEDCRGWRHGVMRYKGDELHFYKLRSLSPFPDQFFLRNKVSHEGRRMCSDAEAPHIGSNLAVIKVHQTGHDYEFALDNQAELAFTAWIESAPSDQLRQSVRRFKEHF